MLNKPEIAVFRRCMYFFSVESADIKISAFPHPVYVACDTVVFDNIESLETFSAVILKNIALTRKNPSLNMGTVALESDAVMLQELAAGPGIFGQNQIHLVQDFDGPIGEIGQIPDRSRHQKQFRHSHSC